MTTSGSDFHFWQRPSCNLLSKEQLDHIYDAALEVLVLKILNCFGDHLILIRYLTVHLVF